MAHTKKDLHFCPFVVMQTILSGKWSILILHHLEKDDVRFNELHRKLEGITQATLSKQLKDLEKAGLIERKVYAQVPPKVEYSLSEIGQSFHSVLEALESFGHQYIQFLKEKEK